MRCELPASRLIRPTDPKRCSKHTFCFCGWLLTHTYAATEKTVSIIGTPSLCSMRSANTRKVNA